MLATALDHKALRGRGLPGHPGSVFPVPMEKHCPQTCESLLLGLPASSLSSPQSFPFWASWGPTPSADVNTYCAPPAMQKQEPSMKPGVCIFNRFPRYFDRRVGLGVASRSLAHQAISVLHGHPPWHSAALLKTSTRAGQLSQGPFQLRLHPYLLLQLRQILHLGGRTRRLSTIRIVQPTGEGAFAEQGVSKDL